MLIDPKDKVWTEEQLQRLSDYDLEVPARPQRLDRGLYAFIMDPEVFFEGEWDSYPDLLDLEETLGPAPLKDDTTAQLRRLGAAYEAGVTIPEYGVCDTPEQFLELYRERLDASPRKFVLSFVLMDKSDPHWHGWRWHKNGPYIGKQEPQCEHFGDEPEIQQVCMFHVHEGINTTEDR